MSYVYYNPNPKNMKTVGDCTVRAISKALNISWETAFIDLVMQAYEMADMPSSNAVMNAYLRTKGFRRYVIDNKCPNCFSVKDFAYDNPSGIYVLGTGSHVITVVDGNYYDSWDSGDVIPIYYYKRDYPAINYYDNE